MKTIHCGSSRPVPLTLWSGTAGRGTKTYGGTQDDVGNSLQQTSDARYIVA